MEIMHILIVLQAVFSPWHLFLIKLRTKISLMILLLSFWVFRGHKMAFCCQAPPYLIRKTCVFIFSDIVIILEAGLCQTI